MGIFQLIEGIITIKRPPKPLGNFSAESTYAAGDQTFDFGRVRKDIYFETDQPIIFKLNSAGGLPTEVGPGSWRITEEWADKMIVTFATSTHFGIYVNG